MKLIPIWRDVIRRAWSVRFMILAGVFSGLEASVQVMLVFGITIMPPGVFAVVSGLLSFAAVVARVVAQKNLPEV